VANDVRGRRRRLLPQLDVLRRRRLKIVARRFDAQRRQRRRKVETQKPTPFWRRRRYIKLFSLLLTLRINRLQRFH